MRRAVWVFILLVVGVLLSCSNPASSPAKSWVVSTLAGSGTAGNANGQGTSAQFNGPHGVAVDSSGNVYVADTFNNRIRKITPGGAVSTLAGSTAGSANGQGTSAQFNGPRGVAVDSSGNVYVTDANNNRIRKITPGGAVSTLAGSTAGHRESADGAPLFNAPHGVAVDSSDNLYVADFRNHRIRKITPEGVVSTLAGSTQGHRDSKDGTPQFDGPMAVAVDSSGNVYIA